MELIRNWLSKRFLWVNMDSVDHRKESQHGSTVEVGYSRTSQAVLALLRREEPAPIIARRYGVSDKSLYAWRDEFLAGGQAALARSQGKADSRDRQIAELQAGLTEMNKPATWQGYRGCVLH